MFFMLPLKILGLNTTPEVLNLGVAPNFDAADFEVGKTLIDITLD